MSSALYRFCAYISVVNVREMDGQIMMTGDTNLIFKERSSTDPYTEIEKKRNGNRKKQVKEEYEKSDLLILKKWKDC